MISLAIKNGNEWHFAGLFGSISAVCNWAAKVKHKEHYQVTNIDGTTLALEEFLKIFP